GKKSIRVSGSLRSSDPHALRMAALSDQGIVLLPDAMVSKDLQCGRLVRILNGYATEQVPVRAVYPSRRQLALKVRTFLDFAAMTFDASAQNEIHTASVSSIGNAVVARGDGRQDAKQMPDRASDRQFAHLGRSPSVVVNIAAARAH